MNKEINVQDLGLKDYKETWDLQERLFKKIIDTKVRIEVKVLNFNF